MEVTKLNFKELRPEIEKAIKSCSFLAIDGEFTGLNNGGNISPFDTPAQYYGKVLSGSLDFLFVQFGLSIFTQISDFKYDNKTYIFYLFPEPLNRDAPDCRFLCQTSSLSFLAKHGFDFNKLFREGIPYLKQSDEDTLRETLETRRKHSLQCATSPSHIEIPAAQKPMVDQAINSIKELLEDGTEKTEVKVERCSAFVRKLVYQRVREELADKGIAVETVKGVLVARKINGEDQLEKFQQEKADQQEEEIQAAVGFVNIIKHIIQSGKLIVGHNMLLDLCHVVHHFVDYLPEDYTEFKEMIHSLFPQILDTKFLCSEGPLRDLFPSTILPSVLETVSKPPFELPDLSASDDDLSFQLDADKYHNSGYDAFVTGVSFLSALRYLETSENRPHSIKSPLLKKVFNRLFLMRAPDTCIHLGGKDPEPPRNHVFHVTFPKTWTSQHLQELFSPFGSVQISWCSDTSAWIGLHDRSQSDRAKKILEGKAGNKVPNVLVTSYNRFQASFGATMQSPRPNKRKSDEPEETSVSDAGKKRRSSAAERSMTTIVEEPPPQLNPSKCPSTNSNGKESALTSLEKQSDASSSSSSFPVDENWG